MPFFGGNSSSATPTTFFGTGETGSATISSNTTLTSDQYYTNLTVNSSIILTTGFFRIYCTGTLTLNGTISCVGGNGGNATGTAAGATSNLTASLYSMAVGSGAGAGVAGATGVGVVGASSSAATNGMGNGGGASSAGGSGTSGSGGGGKSPSAYTFHPYRTLSDNIIWPTVGSGTVAALLPAGGGGAGGGSGAGDGTNSGGGSGAGGQGGGAIGIFANTVVLGSSATITVQGGNGGNGGTPPTGNCGGGGAGGVGGGGYIYIICNSFTYNGTQMPSGAVTPATYGMIVTPGTAGTPGSGVGTGTAGGTPGAGQSGHISVWQYSNSSFSYS